MTSGCLDRKEVRGAIWGVHSTTDRPAGGNTGRLFLAFGGPVCADRISNCPLDRVLTYKNLIYLLNLQFYCVNTPYLTDDSYTPAPAGPAKRQKKTSRVSPPAGLVHYNPLARLSSSCFIRQRDVTS